MFSKDVLLGAEIELELEFGVGDPMYREILLLTVPIGRFEAFASTVVLFAAKDSSDDCSSTTASVAYSIKIYLNITINYITDFLVLLQFF